MKSQVLIWVVVMGLVCPLSAEESPLVLDLAKVIELAQTRAVEVLVAQDRVGQAIGRLEETRSALLPQLTATASQVRRTVNLKALGIPLPGDPLLGPFNSFDARLRLSMELFDLGSIDRLKAARAGRALSEAEARKVRQDATAVVAALYVDARRSVQALNLAETQVRRDERARDLSGLRYRNGSGSAVDESSAEAQLLLSRQRLEAAQTEAKARRLDLLAALGYPLDQPVSFPPAAQVPPPAQLPEADIKEAAASHPDVVLAEEAVRVHEAEQKAVKADYWPRLGVAADYGASGVTPSDSLGTYQFGGQLSLPLFEGGYRGARVQEARHARAESEKHLADVRLKTQTHAFQSNDSVRSYARLVEAAGRERAVAEKELALAERRFQNGSGSDMERLQSQAQAAQARDQEAEALAGYEIARITWARDLGDMDLLKERK